MAANETKDEPEGPPTEFDETPPPSEYRVARSTPANPVENTIDIYGEKPFSV